MSPTLATSGVWRRSFGEVKGRGKTFAEIVSSVPYGDVDGGGSMRTIEISITFGKIGLCWDNIFIKL